MLIRNGWWQKMAALVLACSSTNAWAQLPGIKLSPLNQLGRSWGFGVSDGYHECTGCAQTNQRPNDLLRVANSNLFYVAPEYRGPSMIDRVNPFQSILHNEACVAPGCGAHAAQPMPMTVLPPSPQMYQQFAAPQSTPLPGSNHPVPVPIEPNMIPSQAAPPSPWPSTTTPPSPWQSKPPRERVIPDPVDDDASNRDSLLDEKPRPTKPETVPPPPALRKRQKSDKPLGEEPNSNDSLLPQKNLNEEESLDLLPRSERPPVTVRQPTNQNYSRMEAMPTQSNPSWNSPENAWMLQEYYGNAYSQRQTAMELDARRSGMNRYR